MKIERSESYQIGTGDTYIMFERYEGVDPITDMQRLTKACIDFVNKESPDEDASDVKAEIQIEHSTPKIVYRGPRGVAQLTVLQPDEHQVEILAIGHGDMRTLDLQEAS